MKKYVDFDGVIFDTEKELFSEYHRLKAAGTPVDKFEYLSKLDWYNHILQSGSINDSIEMLKELRDAIILTKVCSLDNEGVSKIKILREFGVKNDIILVPGAMKKTDVVEGNILVDDTIHNLTDWEKAGGLPIYFNGSGSPIDPWDNNIKDTNYIRTRSLSILKLYE